MCSCVYACICTCIHSCVHMCIHNDTRTLPHTHTLTHAHTYIYACMYIAFVYVNRRSNLLRFPQHHRHLPIVYNTHKYTHTHTHPHARMCQHTHTHTHTHMYVCMHVCMNKCYIEGLIFLNFHSILNTRSPPSPPSGLSRTKFFL